MAFAQKLWKNSKAGGTKLNAAGMNDLEERITEGKADLEAGKLAESQLPSSVVTDSLTEAEAMGVIVHGAVAGKARGTKFAQYTWIGSVEPEHMVDGDIWIETA